MTGLAIAVALAGGAWAQTAKPAAAPAKTAPAAAPAKATPVAQKATADEPRSGMPVCAGELPPPVSVEVVAGKSTLVRLPDAITLRTLADTRVAQARLLSPNTLYILGVNIGSTNMVLQDHSGRCTVVDVTVGMDPAPVRTKLAQLMPDEKNVRVATAADSLVLSGVVSDAQKVDQAIAVANAYLRSLQEEARRATGDAGAAGLTAADRSAGGSRVINLLAVDSPQQVMLEVKVAEVSKTVAERLGINLELSRTNGDWTYRVLTGLLSGGTALGEAFRANNLLQVDAEKRDALVKILAEPTVMAISGQEGSFLAGGRVYLPVAQSSTGGATTITLEEKEFGVGLKFTPTVLSGGRINLKVAPEVSEFSREGLSVSAPNVATRQILPLITTRRASTTVQLLDGQSLVIGGLIKNNATTNVKALPFLGELPIIGALFRSSDFTTDRSEVLFVVTPRLVKPLAPPVALPTDAYVDPSRADVFLHGRLEGAAPPPAAPGQGGRASGFELK